MIFDKDANFPYPVLSNKSDSYLKSEFLLSVDLDENTNNYQFKIDYTLDSDFIYKLLETKRAQLVFIVRSGDSRFFNLDLNKKVLDIPKSRLSLSKRTELQLLIQAKDNISFNNNYELNEFYEKFKDEINVPKNSLLGYSNTVIYDGSITKPYELFEKKIDPSLKSDIKIDFGSETIIVKYKSEELQFRNSSFGTELNNPYVYMGLQKALYRFVVNNSEQGEEEVDLDEMDLPSDGVDLKLYNLMKAKAINEISIDTIDEVIYAISDKILEKYSTAVRRLSTDGN